MSRLCNDWSEYRECGGDCDSWSVGSKIESRVVGRMGSSSVVGAG